MSRQLRKLRQFICVICVIGGSTSLYAKCPTAPNLIVKVPVGDIQVHTTGTDSIEVQVDNSAIQVQETCGKSVVEVTSNTPNEVRGTITWKIITPRNVNLDVTAFGGGITIGDVDADATLRTTGGSVTAGQIKGKAAIITQGGSIKAGNVGGSAELRSQGGLLEVGDVGGNAEFQTTAGPIRAGSVAGDVVANGGRAITIAKGGNVQATTNAGDITIGDAARINAKTAGGHIISRRVRGPFQGHTESGDIRLDSVASWVEATTGYGNITVKLVPDNIDGDLHMNLEAGVGDVTVSLPQRLKATVNASIQRPAFQAPPVISDFPMNSLAPANRFYAPTQSQTVLNGGGNKISLKTSLGKVVIKKN